MRENKIFECPGKKISVIMATVADRVYPQLALATLKENLPAGEYEFIVIDNGAKPEVSDFLAKEEGINIIRNEETVSLAVAWNQGANVATGDVFLFLHDDVYFPGGTLEVMYDALFSKENVGAVIPRTNRRDEIGRPKVEEETSETVDIEHIQSIADKERSKTNDIIIWLSDVCILMKREVREKIGCFDESYPYTGLFYLDYAMKLNQTGYYIMETAAYLHHFDGSYNLRGWDREECRFIGRKIFFDKYHIHPFYNGNVRQKLLEMADISLQNMNVLDIGCGLGANFIYMKFHNPTVNCYGIEMDEASAKIAQNFGEVIIGDCTKVERPDFEEKFDLIIMGDVIEHLPYPWEFIETVRKWLTPGGKVIASIPNVMHIENLEKLLLEGRWDYTDAGILDRTHLRFFTPDTAMELFTNHGFSVVSALVSMNKITARQNKLIDTLLNLYPEAPVSRQTYETFQLYLCCEKRT